jgi:hypothetical protein
MKASTPVTCVTCISMGQDKRRAAGKTPLWVHEGTGVMIKSAVFCNVLGTTVTGLSGTAIWSTSFCRGEPDEGQFDGASIRGTLALGNA